MNQRFALFLAPLAFAACSSPSSGSPAVTSQTSALDTASATPDYRGQRERLFTSSNDATGNAILEIAVSESGNLSLVGRVATGGLGSGAGLGSQGALAVTGDRRWLLAVNAGSSELSLLRFTNDGLELSDVAPSGGTGPISVTESRGLVYVLNAGGTQSVTGFTIVGGSLVPLAGSTRGLSAQTPVGAAEVAFSPDGDALVVTEKGTSTIDSYVVRRDGTPTTATTTPSTGATPYGFAFDARGAFVVSDAAGGAPGAGALSSYVLDGHGATALVTGPVDNQQAAPCWVAITPDNRFAYTTNTASGTISGYTLSASGALTLFADDGDTATTGEGTKPADVTIDGAGRLLFALEGGTGVIGAFRIGVSGGLTNASSLAGFPASTGGLVVR